MAKEKVEIVCRCGECTYFESKSVDLGYCYYWKYAQGETPNDVMDSDFCSNAKKDTNK